MRLFICEKPSQARDIAGAMDESFEKTETALQGKDTTITWCFGHLLSLAPPEHYQSNLKPRRMEVLPVVPQQWTLEPKKETQKQLKAIGVLLKKARCVVIATDADRERDVIGREVLDYFNYTGEIVRLWLSALDKASVQKALKEIKPGNATKPLYDAGLARQRADWLVGMNLTMAVSSVHGKRGGGVLSVGRVQTPTLKLVVDRDKDIEHFKTKQYYLLKARCINQRNESFWVDWDLSVGCEAIMDPDGRITDYSIAQFHADRVLNQKGAVDFYEEQIKKQPAPLCFSLSGLQKIASNQLSYGAIEVLDIAQSLYERHKAITYPRTDCEYLPESQFSEVKRY